MVADSSIVSTDGQWRWDGVQWVAQEVAAPSYRVGDVVNGHILRSDGQWHPLPRNRASWIAKAKAVSKLGVDAAKVGMHDISSTAESELGEKELYQKAKASVRQGTQSVKQGVSSAHVKYQQKHHDVGATKPGQVVGEKTRWTIGQIGTMPGLTILTDVVKSRHGVHALHELFVEKPKDPMRAVWLGEAMVRVQRDLLVYRVVRSVTSPTYLLIRQTIMTAATTGVEASDPTTTQLFKHAYGLSVLRLRRDPDHAYSCHVLARVYLAKGRPDQALRFSKLAIMADKNDPLPWVTLSRSYLRFGQVINANEAARRAISLGADYGYAVLADVLMVAEQRPEQIIDQYASLKSAAGKEGTIAYLGTYVDPHSAFTYIKDSQHAKARHWRDKTVKYLDENGLTND